MNPRGAQDGIHSPAEDLSPLNHRPRSRRRHTFVRTGTGSPEQPSIAERSSCRRSRARTGRWGLGLDRGAGERRSASNRRPHRTSGSGARAPRTAARILHLDNETRMTQVPRRSANTLRRHRCSRRCHRHSRRYTHHSYTSRRRSPTWRRYGRIEARHRSHRSSGSRTLRDTDRPTRSTLRRTPHRFRYPPPATAPGARSRDHPQEPSETSSIHRSGARRSWPPRVRPHGQGRNHEPQLRQRSRQRNPSTVGSTRPR